MEGLREAAELGLIAVDPRKSMQVLLDLVKGHTDAAAAALFMAHEDSVQTVARCGVSEAGIQRVASLWAGDPSRLRDNRPCVDRGRWCLWPIGAVPGTNGGLGLLYIEAGEADVPLPVVQRTVEGLRGLLLGALRLDTVAAHDVIDDYLEATPAREVSRRQLLRLLDRNEWNISRVARLAGVTRVTIYKRLHRLGIERLRVRKAML